MCANTRSFDSCPTRRALCQLLVHQLGDFAAILQLFLGCFCQGHCLNLQGQADMRRFNRNKKIQETAKDEEKRPFSSPLAANHGRAEHMRGRTIKPPDTAGRLKVGPSVTMSNKLQLQSS